MSYEFTVGDYIYTPKRLYETNGGMVSTSEGYSFTHTPAITDRYGDGDAYNRWIYVYVFQEDEGETAFVYGTSSATNVRNCKVSYNGSNIISIANRGGSTADVSISVPYDTGETACRVTDKTKTSYANISSTVTSSGTTYTVTDLSSCFSGCSEMTAAPTIPNTVTNMSNCFLGCYKMTTTSTIPSSVTNMDHCFYGCSRLYTAPTIPNGVTNLSYCFGVCTSLRNLTTIPSSVTNMDHCFSYCSNIINPPTISNGVTDIKYCFYRCTGLTTAPVIPTSVVNMDYCFNTCPLLISAPEIPSSVLYMNSCFAGCSSLTGNIVVKNLPETYSGIFTNTTNPIYIVPPTNVSVASVWFPLSRAYDNVHYLANDKLKPTVSNFTALRVGSNGATTYNDQGQWVYLSATISVYDTNIPVGWTNSLSQINFTKDGTATTWSLPSGTSYPRLIEKWINLGTGDTAKHTFTLQIQDTVKDDSNSSRISEISVLTTAILPKIAVLLDFIHENNKEGIAIGSYATRADLFDVSMDTIFRYNIQADLLDSAISGTADYKLYHALLTLGWDDCLSTTT